MIILTINGQQIAPFSVNLDIYIDFGSSNLTSWLCFNPVASNTECQSNRSYPVITI